MVITRPSDFDWLAELCEREYSSVIAYCRRHLDEEQDALDACQETFLRAVLNAEKVQASVRPGGWLMTTARYVCHETGRRRSRWSRSRAQEYMEREVRHSAEGDERNLRLQEVADLVDELTPGQQSVIRKTLQGREPGEIAEELDISRGAVNTQMNRARNHLIELVDERREQEGDDA